MNIESYQKDIIAPLEFIIKKLQVQYLKSKSKSDQKLLEDATDQLIHCYEFLSEQLEKETK